MKKFFHNTSHKLLILSISLFSILRFPSLFEPYWYGDEGIYQIIGRAIRNGKFLYQDAWDNKPPLLYVIYAIFDGDQFLVRLFSLIIGIFTVVLFYALTTLLLKKPVVVNILTLIFALLFAGPYLEGNIANAENFMLLPIFLGMCLVLPHVIKNSGRINRLFIPNASVAFIVGGILLGVSFMIKIVGVFDLFALLTFILLTSPSLKRFFRPATTISLGFVIPWVIVTIFFLIVGRLDYYLVATFFSNVSYVGHENFFLIPQGLLFIKVLLVIAAVIFLFVKRKTINETSLFILTWFVFSLFSSFFSQRSYTHYVLLTLPGLLLIGGILFQHIKRNMLRIIAYIIVIGFLIFHFRPFPLIKSITYYGNFLSYLTGQKTTYEYQMFFDTDVPGDYAIAEYLDLKLGQNEEVLIYGNSAQIYVLSDTLPINRFTVAYHVNNPDAVKELQMAINKRVPSYIVVMPDQKLGEIYLPNYVYRMNLGDTAIYEHIN